MRTDKIIRDYIVATTYRKHELAGQKFEALRDLGADARPATPSPQPIAGLTGTFNAPNVYAAARNGVEARQATVAMVGRGPGAAGVGLADFLAGAVSADPPDPRDLLAAILAYVATPMRWEPLNSSREHRGVASPGSLFIAELRLILRSADRHQAIAMRYLGLDQYLEALGPAPEALLERAQFGLFVVARLPVCAKLYGEFSPCLAGLEGGALAAQAAIIGEALGATTRTELIGNDPPLRSALRLEHWSDVVIARVLFSGPGSAVRMQPSTFIRRQVCDIALETTDVEPLGRLRKMAETFRNLPAGMSAEAEAQAGPPPDGDTTGRVGKTGCACNDDVFDVMRRRSSGHVETQTPILPLFHGDDVLGFLQDVLDLTGRAGNPCRTGVDMLLRASVAFSDRAANGGYEANFATGIIRRLSDDLQSTRYSIAGRNRTMVLTFAIDDLAEMRKWGPAGFWASHVCAGAISQAVGLAAAARHMCARPIRAYADHMVDLSLPLNRRAVFQVICCSDRRADPAYPMAFFP